MDKTLIDQENTTTYKIQDAEVILEDMGINKGKITINSDRGVYTMYWGAMGDNIKDFILYINDCYFTDKLLGVRSTQCFNVKATFSNVRKFIREELCLPWYKHIDFQKDLREKINTFQSYCKEIESEDFFVNSFHLYLSTLPNFDLIEDRFEREQIENDFKNISEPWHFIDTKDSDETKWFKSLHKKLIKKIKKDKSL